MFSYILLFSRFQVQDAITERMERPPIPEDVPHRYANLMRRCWDVDPVSRPSASEVSFEAGVLCIESDAEAR